MEKRIKMEDRPLFFYASDMSYSYLSLSIRFAVMWGESSILCLDKVNFLSWTYVRSGFQPPDGAEDPPLINLD